MHTVTLVFTNQARAARCVGELPNILDRYSLKIVKSVLQVVVTDGPRLVDDLISEGYLDPTQERYFIEGIE